MANLYLVTLPIGNPEDITLRALNCLKENTIIYSEDTRVFKELCKKIEVDYTEKKIYSYHDHSNEKQVSNIIEQAKSENIVFVSDAGSPVISDPAYPLIKMALNTEGVKLSSIGGISSVIVALELSGLPSTPFHFHGFLARDKGKLQQELDTFQSQYGTHIFFEGKSRVLNTLDLLSKTYPHFDIVLARELTKEFESIYRFKGEQYSQIKSEIELRGEFVILINNPEKSISAGASKEVMQLAETILKSGAKPKTLSKLLAKILGKNSKEIYEELNSTRQ